MTALIAGQNAARHRSSWRIVVMVVLAVVLSVLGTTLTNSSASAQESIDLETITPENGSSVDQSPTELVLSFTRVIAETEVVVVNAKCQEVQRVGLPDIKRNVATVEVIDLFPKGTCIITWLVRDENQQAVNQGQTTVQVRNASTSSSVPATASSDPIRVPAVTTETTTVEASNDGGAGGAVWLGRLTSTIGIMIIVGSLALISIGWPEGPEYLLSVRFLRGVWALALAGTVLYVVALAAQVGGSSITAGFNPLSWFGLFGEGWVGRGAVLRLVAVIGLAWVCFFPERIVLPDTALIAWGLGGAAVVATAMARVGGSWPIVGFLLALVNVVAFAFWFGGAALVARVVLAGPGDYDLVRVTKIFSRTSVLAMVVVAVTEVLEVFRIGGGNLFSTGYGRVFLLKVLVLAAMLFVSLTARQVVTRRLGGAEVLDLAIAERFRRAFTVELAIGVVVLVLSESLLSLTAPYADPLASENFVDGVGFIDQATQLNATVFVGPGTPGLNAMKVVVQSPPSGIESFTLTFTPPYGSGAFEVRQTIKVDGPGTYYRSASDGLPLNAAGTWTVTLDASTSAGVVSGQQATIQLANPDGTTPSTVVTTVTAPPASVGVQVVTPETTVPPLPQSSTPTPAATTPTSATSTP